MHFMILVGKISITTFQKIFQTISDNRPGCHRIPAAAERRPCAQDKERELCFGFAVPSSQDSGGETAGK